MQTAGRRLDRSFFSRDVDSVARDLLGSLVAADSDRGRVVVRLTEVEAYAGLGDPASHAFRGPTPRTAVMFGPAGHLYTYFVYGMHWCANVVTGAEGDASAVLLRAGEVVGGIEHARARRPGVTADRALARGPAGLAGALGFDGSVNGADLCSPGACIEVLAGRGPDPAGIGVGPRVGVAAAADVPRRFWIEGDPTVSAFRAWSPRRRRTPAAAPGEDPRHPMEG